MTDPVRMCERDVHALLRIVAGEREAASEDGLDR
jgi:hypothetical protein